MILAIYGSRPEEIKLWPFSGCRAFDFVQVNQSKDLHQGMIDYEYSCEEDELKQLLKDIGSNYDFVMVQGDTRTAFYGALYAYELGIPVIHVEAGLRTHDINNPHPEEGYRMMIDAISTLKYCSTKRAAKICGGKYVGQTSIDTLKSFMPEVTDEGYYIVTLHRTDPYTAVEKIKEIAGSKEVFVIEHPNKVGKILGDYFNTLKPMLYPDFVKLLAGCSGVISDSGGLQEECIAIDKPYYSLRDKSERGHGESYVFGASEKIIKDINDYCNNTKLELIRCKSRQRKTSTK